MIGDSLHKIEQWLISLQPEQMQSVPSLIDSGAKLAQYIAFTGAEMARLKKAYQIAKKEAYIAVMAKLKAEGKEVAPSLVKDYVNTICSDQEERYLMAERLNAACTHSLDLVRSCLSILKTEMATIYNQ